MNSNLRYAQIVYKTYFVLIIKTINSYLILYDKSLQFSSCSIYAFSHFGTRFWSTSFPPILYSSFDKTQPIYCHPLNIVIFRTHQTVFVFGILYCVNVFFFFCFFKRSTANLCCRSWLNGIPLYS